MTVVLLNLRFPDDAEADRSERDEDHAEHAPDGDHGHLPRRQGGRIVARPRAILALATVHSGDAVTCEVGWTRVRQTVVDD